MNRVFYRVICLLCLSFAMSCVAYAESKFIVAPGLMDFDYVETDVDGSFLDGESGVIPGIYIGFETQTAESELLTFGIAFEHYSGEVDYDGHIQTNPLNPRYEGLPLSTKTHENVNSIIVSLSRSFAQHRPLSIYGTFTIKRWERDIQSTSISGIDNFGDPFQDLPVSGLFEIYEWWQFTFGLDYKLKLSAKSYIGFYGGFLRTINPKMKVFNLSFSLEEKWGYEAGLAWMYKLTKAHSLGAGVDYTYWEFGRSNVISNSVEPDSESNMLELKFVYEYSF